MAIELSSRPTKYNEYPRSIRRQGPFPAYDDEIFFSLGDEGTTDQNTARGYARYSPTAYVGQSITVIDKTLGILTTYLIADTLGTLKTQNVKLIDVGEEEDDTKGWTGAKIKDYIAKYVEENGGGGGPAVAAGLSFTGLSSRVCEVGETYSLINFGFKVSTPGTIRSDIEFTCGLYSYKLAQADVAQEQTLAVGSFTSSAGAPLSINGSVEVGLKSYDFVASATDKSGPLTATGRFAVTGCYYAYFGSSTQANIQASIITSDTFAQTSDGEGVQLCSGNRYTVHINTVGNDYIWLCIPGGKTLKSVQMNGYDVTDVFMKTSNFVHVSNVTSHTNLSVTDYNCYRTDLQSANNVTLTIELQ